MLFPAPIIQLIAECAHWADRLTRADLIEGIVVSENDYTSNFTSSFRREINARSIPGLRAKIQVLNPSAERELGADGCVILENEREFKASIFEAKWPRLSTHVNTWDSIEKSTGISHFHSQLDRQRAQSHYAAIWEMFYSEHPFGTQPSYMAREGSACVWHAPAYAASMARGNHSAPWLDSELKMLLEASVLTISQVIETICMCREGRPLPLGKYQAAFGDIGPPHQALVITYSARERRRADA